MSGDSFGPASPQEKIVFGASRPGYGSPEIKPRHFEGWISRMQSQNVQRVCCLLSGDQLQSYGLDLPALYVERFGHDSVCWSPIPDGRLASLEQMKNEILPFLLSADEGRERVVVHCAAGLGRTGQVLAAWLVFGRGFAPGDALRTVRLMGRRPEEAVAWGNASSNELLQLLQSCAR